MVHHQLPAHPATWAGSCFSDLVGARVIPGFDATAIEALLPRLRQDVILRHVGIAAEEVRPASEEALRSTPPGALLLAACAALALPPRPRGRAAGAVQARRTVAVLGRAAGFSARQIADTLEMSASQVRRLSLSSLPPRIEQATRRQVTLRSAVPIRLSKPLAA